MKLPGTLAIRRYLLEKGKASVGETWRDVFQGRLKYYTVQRYFQLLKAIGLIEVVEYRENSKHSPIKVPYYRIVPGREDDPCWFTPWACYWRAKGRSPPWRLRP